VLGRIERLLESAVEGTTRGLFRVRLQPVELAKAATRAMDEQVVIGPDGPEVANAYRIRLHPDDFARFASLRTSLEAKITRYLDTYARDRGLRPVAAWQVDLGADDSVPRRRVRVEAEMVDPDVPPPAAGEPMLEGTLAMPSARPPFPASPIDGPVVATITLEDGRELRLERDATTLGRALDNDVVIADSRVSRHHVQLVLDRHGVLARDLGSTNGTSVAGRKGAEHRLTDGDELSLGGYKVRVRVGGGRS
jgi:hypothetical protein